MSKETVERELQRRTKHLLGLSDSLKAEALEVGALMRLSVREEREAVVGIAYEELAQQVSQEAWRAFVDRVSDHAKVEDVPLPPPPTQMVRCGVCRTAVPEDEPLEGKCQYCWITYAQDELKKLRALKMAVGAFINSPTSVQGNVSVIYPLVEAYHAVDRT